MDSPKNALAVPGPTPKPVLQYDTTPRGAAREAVQRLFLAGGGRAPGGFVDQVVDAVLAAVPRRVEYLPNPDHERDLVRRLLVIAHEDPDRDGLLETPDRFLKALRFYTQGYDQDPRDVLKVFEDGAEGCDEMVVQCNIPFHSLCEHHLAPFFGVAHIGYVPNQQRPKIVGLSKLSRLLDVFARRLQVQERLTAQVAKAFVDCLDPLGFGIVVEARHMCMECRGVQKSGSVTVTSALKGVFNKAEARQEFLSLVGARRRDP